MTEVLVFSHHSTPRLQYTLHWVLSDRFGLDLKITNSEEEFETYQGAKINYNHHPRNNCLNIGSSSILYETTVNENFGEIGVWNGLKIFFKTTNKEIPFDIFGAVFYCISRMEEYGENLPDIHKRFIHHNSVLHKLKVLHIPIVDLWVEELRKVLLLVFPMLTLKPEEFQFVNTFDIDQAFCYDGKGFIRNSGGLLKDTIKLNLRKVKERIMVLSGMKPDPYDTFDYIIQKQKDTGIETIVFLLLADYGMFDKNIAIDDEKFLQLIKLLQQEVTLGIHPSYNSFNNIELIRKEVKRLVSIQFKPVVNSRQHYLKFTLPDTFNYLLESGIRHEYSLGYAEALGFRAGTSHSFHWFDLGKNEVTILRIHPCCVMDVTLKNYLGLSPEKAKEELKKVMNEVKKVNGTFIPIWHNESVSDFAEWKGWREVYESMLAFK